MTKKFHKFMSKTKIKKIKILYKQKLKKPGETKHELYKQITLFKRIN